MENILPEVIVDTIYHNVHEIKFSETLTVVNQLFDDDVELKPDNDDASTLTPTDISISDIETDFTDTDDDDDSYTHDRLQLMRFLNSQILINNIATIDQTKIITENSKILIDLTDECKYTYDELFSDINSFCRPSAWKHIESNLNLTIKRKILSRSYMPHRHKRYNKFYLILHDDPPYRILTIMRILQALKIKCLNDHIYLEEIYVARKFRSYDVIRLFCGS